MAWKQYWLLLAAVALAVVVTSGSARTANDDGICTRVTYYVAREGNRATDGITLTYCASEKDCHRRAVQVCCNGWKRDPDSKKLRCIKIESNNSTRLGSVGIDSDLGGAEDSTSSPSFSYVLQKEASVQNNVRRTRDSASASGNTTAGADRNVNVPARAEGLSVQNPQRGPPNSSADLATKRDGKSEIGAVQNKQTNSPVVADEAGSDTSHPLRNGKQPVGPQDSNTGDKQPKPDTGSSVQLPGTSSSDAPHTTPEKDHPFSESSIGGSSTTQKPLEKESATANGQSAGISNQAEAPSHVLDVPVVIHPESKNNASGNSATAKSEVEPQILPKDHSDEHGAAVQVGRQAGPVSSSATTVSAAASTTSTSMASQTPVPTTSVKVAISTPEVQPPGDQPQGDQPTSTPSPAGDNSVHSITAVPSEVAAANKSRASASAVGQGSNHTSTNGSVVCMPVPLDKNISSTNQSSQDTGSLMLTAQELSHGCHVDTLPSAGAFQSTSAPPILQTNASTTTTTTAPLSTATSASRTGPAAPVPRLLSATPVPKHKLSPPLGIMTTTTTTTPTQSIPHGASTPVAVAIATTVPAPRHSIVQARGELKYGDRCTNSSQCGYDHGVCDKQSGKQLCLCQPEYPVTNHIDMCGKPAKINETCQFSEQCEQTTEKTECRDGRCVCLFEMAAVYKDGSIKCVENIHEYNATEQTSKGNGSTTQRPSDGNSTGQQGGASSASVTEKKDNATSVANCTVADHKSNCSHANCSLVGPQKNCSHTNHTSPTARPQPSTAPPVAKPLGDKPHGATALPSSSSASKTASEVTISLLLVAAVAFVAALLYWRSRRRRRRYINCGTREPNLNFSNPVYDLEAMMEQTSLMKLQNAAEIEDDDGSDPDHEATFQRK